MVDAARFAGGTRGGVDGVNDYVNGGVLREGRLTTRLDSYRRVLLHGGAAPAGLSCLCVVGARRRALGETPFFALIAACVYRAMG